MKKLVACFMLLWLALSSGAQQKFVLEGKISDIKTPCKLLLQYRAGEEFITDSVLLKKGSFFFKGEIEGPTKATLSVHPLKDEGPMTIEKYLATDKQDLYLEKGRIKVKGSGSIENAVIIGGEVQRDNLLLLSQTKPLEQKIRAFAVEANQFRKEKKENAANDLFAQMRLTRQDIVRIQNEFINQHPDSYVSFDLVKDKSSIIDPQAFEPLFNSLSERMRGTEQGKRMAAKLEIAKKTAIGHTALDFAQNNTEGIPVSLSSFRGKYVLLDFWASWCGPCRAENPNVVRAYNKFRDKNFEILSVSLDSKKDSWLKAIEKDGMPWVHVSDLQGWKNSVAVEYGITAVPQNFLLDPNGVIIAKNLRGEELEKQLDSLIKTN